MNNDITENIDLDSIITRLLEGKTKESSEYTNIQRISI
jgi:hypothetical protein